MPVRFKVDLLIDFLSFGWLHGLTEFRVDRGDSGNNRYVASKVERIHVQVNTIIHRHHPSPTICRAMTNQTTRNKQTSMWLSPSIQRQVNPHDTLQKRQTARVTSKQLNDQQTRVEEKWGWGTLVYWFVKSEGSGCCCVVCFYCIVSREKRLRNVLMNSKQHGNNQNCYTPMNVLGTRSFCSRLISFSFWCNLRTWKWQEGSCRRSRFFISCLRVFWCWRRHGRDRE